MKKLFVLLLLIVPCVQAQVHTEVTVEDNQVVTGAKTFNNVPNLNNVLFVGGGINLITDIGTQINNAIASSACGSIGTSKGCTIYVLPCLAGCDALGDYNSSVQILNNSKTITLIGGRGDTNNAGAHLNVGINWTGGAGPIVDFSGTACSGSVLDGFRFTNTSSTLTGFILDENFCGEVLFRNIAIDIYSGFTPALSYGIRFGNDATAQVNDVKVQESRIIGAAPIGVWFDWVSANGYADNTWAASNGVENTVSTSNGALGGCTTNCVQASAGPAWPTDGSWNNVPVLIGSAIFTISTVNSSTSATLTTAPGTQTSVVFARASQFQFGSSAHSSNIFHGYQGYAGPAVGNGIACGSTNHCLGLPVVQYVNTQGAHTHEGTTFEIGSDSGLVGFAQEANSAATINGAINCYGCTMNGTQGPAAGVTAFIHPNNSLATFNVEGLTLNQNTGIMAATSYIFQNDNSTSITDIGTTGQLSVTLKAATGTKGTTNLVSFRSQNGGGALGDLFGGSLFIGCINPNVVQSVGDSGICRNNGTNTGRFWWGNANNQYNDFNTTATNWYFWTPGSVLYAEGNAPACIANNDGFWAEASTHRLKMCNNNAGADTVGDALVQSCGITSTCSATNIRIPQVITGSAPLVSGTPSTVTITGFSPAFTSITSYNCSVTNQTNAANNLLKVVNTSNSSITITGPNTITDVIGFICAGN